MKRILIFVLIGVVLILIRLHFLDEPFERDEGGYGYMAWRFLSGETIYRDFWDTKPPGIIFIYALIIKFFGMSITAVRVCSLFWGLVNAILVYLIAEKIFNERIGYLSMFIFAVFSGGPLTQGSSANAEPFMITFTMLGVYLFLQCSDAQLCCANPGLEKKMPNYICLFFAGIFFGAAFMIKQNAIDGLLAVAICILLEKKRIINNLLILAAGITAVWIPVIFYLVQKGIFGEFLYASYIYNISYIGKAFDSGWADRLSDGFLFIMPENIVMWLLAVAGLFILRGKTLLKLWFLLSLFCVCIGGRFFPHYFIQILPVMCLFSGYALEGLLKSAKRGICVFVLIVLVFLMVINQYRLYFVYTPYEVCRIKYPGVDFVTPEITAGEIEKMTNPDDYIYVWGSEPEMYFYAKRKCPVRYINNHFIENNPSLTKIAKDEIMQGLEAKKPKVIVAAYMLYIFPELERFIYKYYEERELFGMRIFLCKKGK